MGLTKRWAERLPESRVDHPPSRPCPRINESPRSVANAAVKALGRRAGGGRLICGYIFLSCKSCRRYAQKFAKQRRTSKTNSKHTTPVEYARSPRKSSTRSRARWAPRARDRARDRTPRVGKDERATSSRGLRASRSRTARRRRRRRRRRRARVHFGTQRNAKIGFRRGGTSGAGCATLRDADDGVVRRRRRR